jgi:fibronectin-binding autotransporter adhesin
MKTRALTPHFAALLIAAGIIIPWQPASAAPIYWDGTLTDWGALGAWSTAVGATTPDPTVLPGTGDVATFSISTVTTAQTVNLNGARSVGGLSFLGTNTAATTLLGGSAAQTLTLGASGIITASGAGAVTIGSTTAAQNVNIALGAAQSWQVNSANALTVLNIVSGANSLTKTGTGTLVLSGVNTYSGGTIINAGIVRATVAGALGTGTVTLGGGTLALANDAATAFNRAVTVNTNSTISSDRAVAGAGVAHTLTTLSIGAQTLTVNRGSLATSGTGGVTFSGATTLTGAAIFDPLANSNLTLTGVVSGAFGLTKGAGLATATGSLTLNGANTYTGVTTVNGGALVAGNASSLGANTSVVLQAVASANASTLDIRTNMGTGKTLTMNTNTTGDLRSNLNVGAASAATWQGNIAVAGTGFAMVQAIAGGTLTIGGNITSTGGGTTGTFAARGAGTVVINGNVNFGTDRNFTHTDAGTVIINSTGNTWRSTQISNGQMQNGIDNALATTVDLVIGQNDGTSNGRYELNGFNQTVAALRTFATSTATSHVIRNSNLTTPSTLTFTNAATEVLKGTHIQGIGALTLVKNGAGRFELQDDRIDNAAINVNAGTLAFTGTTNVNVKPNITGLAAATIDKAGTGSVSMLGTYNHAGPTTVSAGTLTLGAGTTGSITVAAGATLGAGLNYTSLTSGAVTFGTGATTFKPVLGFPAGDTPIPLIAATTLAANGTTTVTPLGAGLFTGVYPLISYTGSIGGNGFGGFTLGAVGTYPHMTAALVNNSGAGRLDLNVTAVDTLTWTGVANGTWDLNTTANFKLSDNITAATFYPGDSITFNDSGGNKSIATTGSPVIGNLIFDNSIGNDYTVTGVLTGIGGIFKSNTGTATLVSANTFTGPIEVSGGTLLLSGANVGHGAVGVQSGGTLKLGNANAISGGAMVTVSPGGTLDVNGQAPGLLIPEVHASGAGVGGLGAITNTGAGITNVSHIGKLVLDGDTSWGSTVRWDIPNTVNLAANGFTLTKVGPGETWFFPTITSQPGAVVVNGGNLGVQTTNPLAAAVPVTVNTGAFHSLYSAITVQHPVTINDGGTLRATNATPTISSLITINDNATANHFLTAIASTTLNVTGKVTGQGGFTHNGGGTLTLQNATNDYTGDTVVTSGTLGFANGGQIPTTTNLVVNGGTFATGAINRTVASLSGTGGTISGGGILTVNQSTNTTWAGTLTSTALTKNGNGTLTLAGSADNGGAAGIGTVNAGTLVLAKTHTAALAEHAFGGGLIINSGGTVQLGGTSVGPFTGTAANLAPAGAVVGQYVDQIFNNVTVALNTGGTLDMAGKSESVQGLTGGGTVTNSVAATNSRLYLGSAGGTNVNGNFAGLIQDGAGVVEVEKLGANTLVLAGNNTYTGATIITGGTLQNTGTLGNTTVTVNTGGTYIASAALGGSVVVNTGGTATTNGNIGGSATVNTGGVFNPATATSVAGLTTQNGGTFNVGGNSSGTVAATLTTGSLTLSGGTINVDFTGTAADQITSTVTNGLTINGANTVNVAVGPGGWLSGSYPLYNYAGTVQGTGASALTLSGSAGHSTASIVDNGSGIINLQVIGAGNSVWVGGAGNAWDTNATLNWTSSDNKFLAGDVAVFDNTATTYTPNIATAVAPAATLFNGPTNYTLSGAAGIAGAGSLTKQGASTVTLLNPNTYTGATNVEAGTLIANYNAGAAVTVLAAASTVNVSSGATFRAIANDAAFTLSNPLAGTGTVELNAHATAGTASLAITLNGASSNFSGTLRLLAPAAATYRVAPSGPAAFGTAAIDVKSGAQLFLTAGTYSNNLTIAGTGYVDGNGNIGALRMEGSTWAGNIVVDAAGARIGAHGGTGIVSGNISGGNLSVNATNYNTTSYTSIFTGTNTYGTTTIGGAATAGTGTNSMRLNIGANGTTGTLGTGTVTINGDGMNGVLAFDRSDGYSLLPSQTITGAGTTLTRTFIEFDTQGTGFNSNGNAITLGTPAAGGVFRVGYNRANTVTNINSTLSGGNMFIAGIAAGTGAVVNLNSGAAVNVANISVGGGTGVAGTNSTATLNINPGAAVTTTGNLFLGDQSSFIGTVSQTGGSVNVGTQIRIAHWPNNTSAYNISSGTLAVNANAALATDPSNIGEQNGGIYLGIDGTGILNQSGTSTITTDWVVLDNRVETPAGPNQPDGIDRYNLSGGTLEIRGQFGISNRNATTEFNFTGGTIKNVGGGVNMRIAGLGNFVIGSGGTGTPTLDTNGATNAITVSRAFTGAGTLVKAGAGTLNLNAASPAWTGNFNITGGTVITGTQNGGLGSFTTPGRTINAGTGTTVNLTTNSVLGSGVGNANLPTINLDGATLSSTRYNVVGPVNLSNGATLTQASTDTGSSQGYQLRGDVAVTGTSASSIATTNGKGTHLNTNTTFTVADVTGNSAADLTVSTPLLDQSADFTSAAGGFTKAGAGTMTLTGISTYTGATTVSAGTLNVASGASLANAGGVTVASGAIFTVDGTVMGTTTVNLGGLLNGSGITGTVSIGDGTIAPGNSPGLLSTGNLTTTGATTFSMDIAGTTPVTQHDKLSVTGSIDIGSTSILTLNITSTPIMGETYFLITNDLSDPINGTFSGIPDGGLIFQGAFVFEAHYTADSGTNAISGGNDFALMVVPEPTIGALALLTSAGLLRRRRR